MPSPLSDEEAARLRTLAEEVSEEAVEAGQVADEEEHRFITDSDEAHGQDQAGAEGKTPVVTAFLVYQTLDGHWAAETNLSVLDTMELARGAVINDFTPACAQVRDDVLLMKMVQNTVQNLINAQMQIGQQLAQRAEHDRIAAAIANNRGGARGPGGGLRG